MLRYAVLSQCCFIGLGEVGTVLREYCNVVLRSVNIDLFETSMTPLKCRIYLQYTYLKNADEDIFTDKLYNKSGRWLEENSSLLLKQYYTHRYFRLLKTLTPIRSVTAKAGRTLLDPSNLSKQREYPQGHNFLILRIDPLPSFMGRMILLCCTSSTYPTFPAAWLRKCP